MPSSASTFRIARLYLYLKLRLKASCHIVSGSLDTSNIHYLQLISTLGPPWPSHLHPSPLLQSTDGILWTGMPFSLALWAVDSSGDQVGSISQPCVSFEFCSKVLLEQGNAVPGCLPEMAHLQGSGLERVTMCSRSVRDVWYPGGILIIRVVIHARC